MTTTTSRVRSSILPFLPLILRGGFFFWPPAALKALKALAKGPESSLVDSGEALYDSIMDLRHEVGLKEERLKKFSQKGYALFFDDLISRADSRRWFWETLPWMARLLLRFPDVLDKHYKEVKNSDITLKNGERNSSSNSTCSSNTANDNSEEHTDLWSLDTSISILHPQHSGIVLLSQELVAAILACAFFCLFPMTPRWACQLPVINFDGLFAGLCRASESQEHKIKCIVHYFERIRFEMPHGAVSFERKVLPVKSTNFSILYPNAADWSESKVPLCTLKVMETGTIEDHEEEALEVDFANKYLGGGALNNGCVQEEIRFMINPELIAGALFLPAMQDNESIEIVGAERFSKYEGYASTFRFAGDYIDRSHRDFCGRRQTRIIAIDALCYPGRTQFKQEKLTREVNKAFCGFLDHEKIHRYFKFSSEVDTDAEGRELRGVYDGCRPQNQMFRTVATQKKIQNDSLGIVDVQESSSSIKNDFCSSFNQELSNSEPSLVKEDLCESSLQTNPGEDGPWDTCSIPYANKIGIATGNWGCGAFGGDVDLKSMLQWLAASQASRPFVLYFAFGEEFSKRLKMFTEWVTRHCWTVGELWDMLIEYSSQRLEGKTSDGFFRWVLPYLYEDPEGKT